MPRDEVVMRRADPCSATREPVLSCISPSPQLQVTTRAHPSSSVIVRATHLHKYAYNTDYNTRRPAPPSSRPTMSSCTPPARAGMPVTPTPLPPPPTPPIGTSHRRRRLEGSFLWSSVCVIKFPPVVSVLLASSEPLPFLI